MRPEEHDAAYLWDMLQAARSILGFTDRTTYETFSNDEMLRMAVERGFQILGDAARRVSEAFRSAHSEIPWKGIIAQRNVIVHDYLRLDPERIWEVIQKDLSPLVRELERLLPPVPPAPGSSSNI